MKARFTYHPLKFIKPAGTSRGWLTEKPTWFLYLEQDGTTGRGEVPVIPGLSRDPLDQLESKLEIICNEINSGTFPAKLFDHNYPAINFGIESALLDLENGGRNILFHGPFAEGKFKIPINGLVWMGEKDEMLRQAKQKVKTGFPCIKIKVGALDFGQEVKLLEELRNAFPRVEIRLDANGAFMKNEVFQKLETLSTFNIHSIEQPVRQGQHELMEEVCRNSPIPVALDEELITYRDIEGKYSLLEKLHPAYIILKPSLLGGFRESEEWIAAAGKFGIAWWATSALESNIGLNAIAQWVSTKNNPLPQGLGTGSLFENNIPLPLVVENGFLNIDM